MSKKREGKGINISPVIHKMLKLQSTLVGDNMVDLVEKAILDSMPEEIKQIVYKTENINSSEFEQKNKVSNIDENVNKESKKESSKEDEPSKKQEPNEEQESNEEDELSEEELSCYV